jgi:uncharacterized membrane protein
LMPIFGAALGARRAHRFRHQSCVHEGSRSELQPGSAALFVLIRKVTADKVLDAIKRTGGVVLKTSLDHDKSKRYAMP